jgi:putative hydrolase of the HAD superfamily
MTAITTVFFDIGGVLGTNGWDHTSRQRAAKQFAFDYAAFEQLHSKWSEALDTGAITVHKYIVETVLKLPGCASVSLDDFLAFMKTESQPNLDSIAVARRIAASKEIYLGTLNNESVELNDYRIEKFALRPIFQAFFSSGYLGVRKPDALIYERALHISQRDPKTAVFIDDRDGNLQHPRKLGMKTVQFSDAAQLEQALTALGVQCAGQQIETSVK